MTDSTTSIGNDLAKLRAESKKSQPEVVEELRATHGLRIDASRLSRIETGLARPTEEEADKIPLAIGTRRAAEYRDFVSTVWSHLPKPSYWHPDRLALTEAENALCYLNELERSLAPGSPLRPQLELYERTLRDGANYLREVTHDVVPIGRIAVGKSTASAAITGLMLDDNSLDLEDRIVLETGQGRTTICEVIVCNGPEFSIRVEPYSENEIRQLVRDFCAALFPDASSGESSVEDREEGVGEEIERALRNMSGLTQRLEKEGNQQLKVDTAVQLLGKMATSDERRAAFFNHLQLPRRTVTQIRFDPSQGRNPLEWLKETFQQINHGLRADVSLPRSIEIQRPARILGDEDYSLRWVDTKGIDQTAIRADLQKRIEDPRSLLVLCSGFAEAPGESAQQLIEHSMETGLRSAIDNRCVLLALARDRDARGMRDPATLKKVKSDQEGYDEKARQVQDSGIWRRYSLKVPILFLNATSATDCQTVAEQLRNAVRRMRNLTVTHITETNKTIREVLADLDRARSEAAQREVNHRLNIFLRQNESLTDRASQVFMQMIQAIQTVNAQSVKASVRRCGDWEKLDVYLLLASGAAREAQSRSAKFFNRLDGVINQMLGDNNLAPSHRFLNRLSDCAMAWREQFVAEVRQVGGEIFRSALSESNVWLRCSEQRAPDYRQKVARLLREWFERPPATPDLLEAFEHHIQGEWPCQVLDEFRKLCEQVGTDHTVPRRIAQQSARA